MQFDQEFVKAQYKSLSPLIKNKAKVILFPIEGKEGVVYGMDNKSGALVKFDFARASKGTYFDSIIDMKEAEANIPRIDFGNYSADRKILIEKESTNLILDSIFENGLDKYAQKYRCELVNGYDTFNFINRVCQITRGENSPGYLYQRDLIDDVNIITLSSFIYNPNRYTTNTPSQQSIGTLNTAELKNQGRANENVYYENGFNRASSIGYPNISEMKSRGWVHYAVQTLYPSIHVFGMQLELQDKQTSYIPTYGEPVTRSKDSLSLNIANNSSVLVCGTDMKQVIDKQGLFKVEDYIQNDGLTLLAIFDPLSDGEKESITNSNRIPPIMMSAMSRTMPPIEVKYPIFERYEYDGQDLEDLE